MQSLQKLCLALSFSALLTACINHEDKEGCLLLQRGPASIVTAVAAGDDGPFVAYNGRRYDIRFVAISGGNGGRVRFRSEERGDFVLYLNKDIPLQILSTSGATVDIKATTTSSTECTEIHARHVAPFEVGSYTLSFGPTTDTSVGFVIEEAGL